MKISNDIIEKIFYEQLALLNEEQEIFSSRKFSEEAKMLLISAEFFVRLYDIITEPLKDALKDPAQISSTIDSALKDPQYNKILDFLSNFSSTNKNMEFIKTTILNGNKFIVEFARNIRDIKIKDPKILRLIFGNPQQTGFLKDIINFKPTLDKMLVTARKLFNASSESAEFSKEKIPPQMLESISGLEKLAFNYLSEVETLFQKLYSISQYQKNKDLRFGEYEPLKSAEISKQILNKDIETWKDLSDEDIPKLPKEDKLKHFSRGEVYGFKSDRDREDFSLKKFLNSLYRKEFSESSLESKKAFIIHRIIQILRNYESDVIPRLLKKAHGVLWNPNTKKYAYHAHIFTIYNAFQQGRNQSTLVFPKILKKMDESIKNNETINIFLENNLKLIDASIKFIQFWKVNLKKSFLSIVSGEKSDIEDPQEAVKSFSDERRAEVEERLFYWDLFRKLGWTSDDAPKWIYR